MLGIARHPAAPGPGLDQWAEPPFFWLQGLIALDAFVMRELPETVLSITEDSAEQLNRKPK